MSDIESKVVFALAPDGTGDGVPLVMLGIPAAAWENLKSGRCSTFDLTKVGVPVKLMLFGAADHAEAMRLIEAPLKAAGLPILDERRRDFSIGKKG